MEDFLIDIVKSKEFSALNANEKFSLKDWCENEDDYNQLKLVFAELDATKLETESLLSDEIKHKLDDLFLAEHKKQKGFFLNTTALLFRKDVKWYSQPIVQIAALFVVFFSVYSLLKLNPMEQHQVAENVKRNTEDSESIRKDRKPKIESDIKIDDSNKVVDVKSSKTNSKSRNQEKVLVKKSEFIVTQDLMGYEQSPTEQTDETQISPVFITSAVMSTNYGDEILQTFSYNDLSVSESMDDVDGYQSKPVSIEMLDVLYTMY
jgi:hypothetical protein